MNRVIWGMRSIDMMLAALSGLLLSASFPQVDFGPLVWMAFVPLFFALRETSPQTSFKLGYLTGLIHYGTLFYWIVGVVHHYGQLSAPLCAVVFTLLLAYLSLYPAVFALALSQFRRRGFPLYLTAPVFWVSLEYARAYCLSGFPWENIGHSQYRWLNLIQVSDILGVYGVTALILAVNAVLFRLADNILRRRGFAWMPAIVVALVMAGFLTYGTWRIERVDKAAESAQRRTVVLAQGNIDQSKKWLPSFQHETLRRYGALSAGALGGDPDLIIWPETALPFYFLHNEELTRETLKIVSTCGVHFILGSPSFRETDQGTLYFNSAYLVAPNGSVLGRYDKVHLVPYGEYVPFKRYFPFLGKMVEAVGDFVPGETGQVLSWDGVNVGILICFEGIFPELARSMVQNGAQLLVNITNDAWFGRSSAPYQHLSMVVFRAVENHLAVARAANTGISAFVDPVGRLVDQTPLFEEATLGRALPLMTGRSFYARHGDLFALGCILASLIIWTVALYRKFSTR